MNPEEFAAKRDKDLTAADELLRESVERALLAYAQGQSDWADDLIDDAVGIWEGHFLAEAPRADADRFLPQFRQTLGESLEKTEVPSNPPTDAEIDRVMRWVSTYTINDATFEGVGARGGRSKRWVTMHDNAVRATHVAADGQIQDIAEPFNVGGYELRFPGDPVGPPAIWINCRCVVQPAARRGEANVSPTTFAIADEEEVIDEDLPVDELEDDEEEITEIPVHGVLAPEGVATGDGRRFAEGALTNRDLPLPIAYQLQSGDGHSGSVTVGRIDEMFRVGNEMRFRGAVVLTKEHSPDVVEGIIDGTVRGISVDVDDIELEMADESEVEEGKTPVTTFSHARIAGVTIVPIPAFQEAYISLGHEFADELDEGELTAEEALAACGCKEGPSDEEDEESFVLGYNGFAPGTKDGPGWITHPVPTARIRRYWVHGKGAAKIRWGLGAPGGDFNRCRRQLAKYVQNPKWLAGLCANMHKEATGFWPGSKVNRGLALNASGEAAPMFTLIAAAQTEYPREWFENPGLAAPAGVTVDGNRIYGYVATWGVCHIGIPGVCTTAPKSLSNYAYFNTGVINTDDGGQVRVGQITMDTGHASIKANAKVAASHYDNTGSVVADVACGEDAIGIWFAGVLRSSATPKQIENLARSGRLSGDWRNIGGSLELVAALAVNVPGFPIPHSIAASGAEGQMALVAAGVVDEAAPAATSAFNAQEVAGIVRTAIAEYRHAEKREAQAAPIREALRVKRIESLRSKIKD